MTKTTDAERDFTIARQVAAMSDTDKARPKHIRLAGLAYLLGALMCFGFTFNGISFERRFFPKLMVLIPVLGTLGVWHLLDANALAIGRRRHQKAILWGSSAISCAVGIALIECFRRGWL